jgi:hypothetical protein
MRDEGNSAVVAGRFAESLTARCELIIDIPEFLMRAL